MDDEVRGYHFTRLYFTTKLGGHVVHHSFKGSNAQAAARKAVVHLCRRYKISLTKLIQEYKRKYEPEEYTPRTPTPPPSPTPPSPEERQRMADDRREYLRLVIPAAAPTMQFRNRWTFYSDAEEEEERTPYLAGPEWEPEE